MRKAYKLKRNAAGMNTVKNVFFDLKKKQYGYQTSVKKVIADDK